MSSNFDPVVPIKYDAKFELQLIREMRNIKQRSGLHRFLIVWPDLGTCAAKKGLPTLAEYRQFAESLLRMKDALLEDGIDVGWYVRCNIASYTNEFQNIIGIDGQKSEVSCPLDPNCGKKLGEKLAVTAETAKPFLILLEEDAVSVSHGVKSKLACFCPLHMEELARRTGKNYSISELAGIFATGNEQCTELRKTLAQLNKDALVKLASDVREIIDKVAPSVRLGICQVCTTEIDGDCIEAVAKAYAGKTKPLVRLHGAAGYTEDYARQLAPGTFNALYYCQHLPDDFELIHETDPCPHTRFYASSAKVKSLMGIIISYGFDSSLFWCLRYLPGDVQQEHAYYDMYAREAKRFNALKRAVSNCELDGCEICGSPLKQIFSTYDPATNTQSNETFNAWLEILARFSIPYTTKDGVVKTVSGDYIKTLDDSAVKNLLRSNVLIDGKAAYLLAQRGFGKHIGAGVKVFHGRPDVAYEIIVNDEVLKNVSGERIPSRMAHDAKGILYELIPEKKALILSRYMGHDGKLNIPVMQCFANPLGGRIGILATDLDKNLRGIRVINVIDPRRKEVLIYMLEWLAGKPLPCVVKDVPNVFCIFNRDKNQQRALITLVNTIADSFAEFTLKLAPEWQGSEVRSLRSDGKWRKVKTKWNDDFLTLNICLRLMQPIYLELKK